MFLSREIDIKLRQIIRKSMYMKFCIIVVGLNGLYGLYVILLYLLKMQNKN